MNSMLLLAAGTLQDTARETALTFGLDWPHFIAQCISFAIVAFLLHRFAYKPVLKMLEERKQRIAESLANAERIKEELAKTEQARQEILAQANAQANRAIEEARAAAAKVLETETQKAIAAANQIIAKANEANAAEIARLRAELKREIGRLAVQAAMQVTGKILTPEDQKRLVEETNRELAA
ncbi:F0F1 ATP synthase subunit B [Fontisphaera persica]|uniref:F0F1 ATP synthase subunit B n=1 Tax=Fontisphaera persica TaxID=2974023 RepID=UPI0024BF4A36|nr:F0F1 ATP synthase subunit B [Fontisphaera persica]WCJ61175.1 F0F1 ATP synthase subunit B [Fontisphaera persica]